ncbi:DUF305 domain-containing protein [Herbidospora cretacea]|uniref:DUF305 domain-containing protein n=1 Tax=Herbidospora cretacea TaxID=28444 RepID=UPI0007C86C63|nr:DUF305 domain-containing protein [Herbidospora cretacea]
MKRLAIVLALVAGCSAPPPPAFNAADVMFLQMMIPHHEQGIEMAKIAEARSARPEVKALASAIRATQSDEAKTMTTRLTGWDQPMDAPPGSHDAHGGLHETRASDILSLNDVPADQFDTNFLNLLTGHQHNAVDMARTEMKTGRDTATKDLAGHIEESREAQIKEMLRLLSAPQR